VNLLTSLSNIHKDTCIGSANDCAEKLAYEVHSHGHHGFNQNYWTSEVTAENAALLSQALFDVSDNSECLVLTYDLKNSLYEFSTIPCNNQIDRVLCQYTCLGNKIQRNSIFHYDTTPMTYFGRLPRR